MNKDLIKSNKEVFEHWLHGGDCLIYSSKSWQLLHWDSDWDFPNDTKIAINDLYVSLRQAIALGKVVQRYNNMTHEWIFMNIKPSYEFVSDTTYRVKPDIEINEWIVNRGENVKPFKVTREWLAKTSLDAQEDFVKWRPVLDEVCWFFEDTELPTLALFKRINGDGLYVCEYGAYMKCVPYVGEAFWKE